MQTVTVAEAAEKLTDLIDAALRGKEIVITIMRSHHSTYPKTTS